MATKKEKGCAAKLTHRQTIKVTWLGHTGKTAPRLRATASYAKGSVTIPHEQNVERETCQAAEALAKKLGWTGKMVGGLVSDGVTVFVFVD